MERIRATLTLESAGGGHLECKSHQVRFSPHACFLFDDSAEDQQCLACLANHLLSQDGGKALYGPGPFLDYLLKHQGRLKSKLTAILADDPKLQGQKMQGLAVVSPDEVPADVSTVFLCATKAFDLMRLSRNLPPKIKVLSPELLPELDLAAVPERAWIPAYESIYPMDIPEIQVQPGLEVLLLDCPARNLSLMPNGIAHVYNALLQDNIICQTLDLDIIVYHRFHMHRLLDTAGLVTGPNGQAWPEDPWAAEEMGLWSVAETLEFFRPELEETVAAVVGARPKILALSIQQCNTIFAREVVNRVRELLPETVILVGGYSCLHYEAGLHPFPECDYMVIGESDLTVGPLVKKILAGEKIADHPGVLSHNDSPDRVFVPGQYPEDLDALEIPQYQWADLDVYRNYNHYRLTPVCASRGCRWSQCRFCGERFTWRFRDPAKFVDELAWLYERGCDLYVFNESDLNGDPKLVAEICREIIRRGLKVRLSGQLRIDKGNTPEFFELLKQAGFIALRFGVDGWSNHCLKLQAKGYTVNTANQNMRDCFNAGIPAEVNAVVGVPGETDQDIDDCIELMLANKPYIWRLANINPLQLITGSMYWEDPDKYKIRFKGDREKIYRENTQSIPPGLWYSEDPFIDHEVREERVKKIVLTLHQNGFDLGAGASPKLAQMQHQADAQEEPGPAEGGPTAAMIISHAGKFYQLDETILAGTAFSPAPQKRNPGKPRPPKRTSDRPGSWPGLPAALVKKAVKALPGRAKKPAPEVLGPRPSSAAPGGSRSQPKVKAIETEVCGTMIGMVKENVKGYNIIKYLSDFYAVKHGYQFEPDKVRSGEYGPDVYLVGKTIPEVDRLIDEAVGGTK